MLQFVSVFCFFFFNDTATTEIYTLSLHDALPILRMRFLLFGSIGKMRTLKTSRPAYSSKAGSLSLRTMSRSEEHTSELQSRLHLVCRLLLEKKKQETDNVETTQPPQCKISTTRHP